jgi:predicted phage terminase large subunit-like protein
MLLNKIDMENVEREYCRRSLAAFARQAWHVLEPAAQLKWGWCLDAICEHLEAVTNGDINRLLMNVPPGSAKSLLTGVFWPAWEWGPRNMPWKRFIGTAHEEQLAIRDSRKCRDLIKSSWYQNLWPLELSRDQDGKKEFGNVHKGVRQARAFTSMTGVRGDCLLGDAVIFTENHGEKHICDIVNEAYSGKVLSYEIHTRRLVYRHIQAVARRSSLDFYQIHTTRGSMVKCTGDHKIYTSRGYIQARFLSPDDVLLRAVRNASKAECLPDEKAHKKWVQIYKLLRPMQSNTDKQCSREIRSKLQYLWSENSTYKKAVLSRMQSDSTKKQGIKAKKRYGFLYVYSMRYREACEIVSFRKKVLFYKMQELASLRNDVRREKPEMARRCRPKKVFKRCSNRVQTFSGNSHGNRLFKMCNLRFKRTITLSPYRFRLYKQRYKKLSDALQELSCGRACGTAYGVKTDTIYKIERYHKQVDVYDIQIEGTNCFFANGILVHNCIILDDPISADAANSEAKLEAARIAFTETLPTRVNSDKSAIVVIMQRLHEKDVSGVIEEMGLDYCHLVIPMRFEAGRTCRTSIGWEDPRTTEGELMFPERFSEAQVSELEKTLGSYGTAGQLQQRPAPRGGGILKEAWFKFWSKLPILEFRTIHADTAQKTGQENDYSVFQCWGRSLTGEAVLIDQIRGKWEAPELLVQCRSFWRKHLAAMQTTAKLRGLYVEDKSSGTGLVQTLRREGIPVLAVQRNKDKISRGYDAAPFIESGNVLLPADAPWLSDFLAEVASFPGGAHDDQLDPLFDAIATVQAMPALEPGNNAVMPRSNRW